MASFLDDYESAGQQSVPAAKSFLDQYEPAKQPAAAAAQPTTDSGLWPQVVNTAKYIGKRIAAGAMAGVAANEAGNPVTAYLTPELWKEYNSAADPRSNNKLLNIPDQPPNVVGRLGGAVGEAVGYNPASALLFPGATAGGALGGEIGGLPGAIIGGAAGNVGQGIVRGMAANKSLPSLANSITSTPTREAAGVVTQAAAKDWLDKFPEKESAAWAPLDAKMYKKGLPAGEAIPSKLVVPQAPAASPGVAGPQTSFTETPGQPLPNRLTSSPGDATPVQHAFDFLQIQPPGIEDLEAGFDRVPGAHYAQPPVGPINPSQGSLVETPGGVGRPTLGLPSTPRPPGPLQSEFGEIPGSPGIPASPGYPKGPPAQMDEFLSRLKSLASGAPAGELSEAVRPAAPGLNRLVGGLTRAGVLDADGNPTGKSIPWDDLRWYSSWLGGQIKKPGSELGSLGDDNLKNLYQGLMEDQKFVAEQNGAGKEFEQSLAESKRLRDLRDNRIAPLVEPGVDPEKAVDLAMKGASKGGSNLAALRGEMPGAVDALAAGHLNEVPKNWQDLAPGAKAQLIPDPVRRAAIDSAVSHSFSTKDLTPSLGQEALSTMVGGGLSTLYNHLFGGLDPITAAEIGHGVGAMVPLAAKAGMSLVKNPRALVNPLTGGIIGAGEQPQK